MTTYGALKTRIALLLQDSSNRTFTTGLVAELATAGFVEVGRLAPERFTEDITPVADQLTYTLRSSDFAVAVPEIDLMRVEVWDPTQSPEAFIARIAEAGRQPDPTAGDTGWYVWEGILNLPTRSVRGMQGHESDYVWRVWGYSPYVVPDSDDDVVGLSPELEQAIIDYARFEGLQLLLSSRDLFSQWQTRSGNTDMSPAALMNQWNIARSTWDMKAKAISRFRSPV